MRPCVGRDQPARTWPNGAGVSRTTVSFVLNSKPDTRISPATQKHVLDAAVALGYHRDERGRHFAAGPSSTIGLVLRQSPEQVAADGLLAETLRGISEAARAGGHRVLLEPLPAGPDNTYGVLLRSGHADGLIVSSGSRSR